MKICSNCGAQSPDDSKFCTNCGSLMQQAQQEAPQVQPPVSQPQQAYQPPVSQPQQAYQPPVSQQNYQQPVVQQSYVQSPAAKSYGQPPAAQQPSYGQPPAAQQPSYAQPPAAQQPSYAQPPAAQQPSYAQPPAAQQPSYAQPPAAQRPSYAQPPAAQRPSYGQPPVAQKPYGQPPVAQSATRANVNNRPRKKVLVPIAIAAGALVVLVIAISLFSGGPKDLPAVSYSYVQEETQPDIQYTVTETVFPSLYRTLDSLVTITATNEGGNKDVLVKMEVPGFTQSYEQKVTLSPQITKLLIHPPMLTGDINLNTEKDAQLVLSITDVKSGKSLVQDSKNIRIMSKYDVIWWDEKYKDSNNDNILAWMTPDSPGILKLKRDAVDYLSYVTDGELNAIVGYQEYGYDDIKDNTWIQALAIQGAMSDYEGVRYNNASFSLSSDVQQRVMLPDDVLKSQSGICIETALVMASALQSAGMHPMLIFPPGHAQVAVECWPNTGEYFLIETTTLPLPANANSFSNTVLYLTKDQWQGYIDGTGKYTLGECYVLDCELGKKLGILPMSN